MQHCVHSYNYDQKVDHRKVQYIRNLGTKGRNKRELASILCEGLLTVMANDVHNKDMVIDTNSA